MLPPHFLPEGWEAGKGAYTGRRLMLSYGVGQTAVGDGVSVRSAPVSLYRHRGFIWPTWVWNRWPLFAADTTNIYPHVLIEGSTEHPFPCSRLTNTRGPQIWLCPETHPCSRRRQHKATEEGISSPCFGFCCSSSIKSLSCLWTLQVPLEQGYKPCLPNTECSATVPRVICAWEE